MKAQFLTGIFSALILFGSFAQAHDGSHPAGHLKFDNGAVHAHLFWESGPNNGSESVLRVEFMDGATHQPIEIQAELGAKLWMPSMGHGSAPTTVSAVLDSQGAAIIGAYRISNIFFIMPGVWEIQLSLTNADTSKETQTWKVDVDGTGGGHHGHH